YGTSYSDTRNSYTALVNYRPPVSKHWKLLSNGWQTSAPLSFHTGQPFTIYTGGDNSGTDEGFQRPNLVGDPFASVSHQIQADSSGAKFVQWVNPLAFAQRTAGTFGNLARNKCYGPGYGSVDFSIYKNTKVTERIGTQFRIEIFNLFNRVNLALPNNFTGGGFGQVTDTIGDFNGAPGI